LGYHTQIQMTGRRQKMGRDDSLVIVFALLILFQLKHLICDYPLQGKYMLGKFKPYPHYVLPLAAHSLVHGLGTTIILLFASPSFWWLGLGDFFCHFWVDRLKASPVLFGRWKPDNKYFWWALGFDQYLHHLWHYAIILTIVLQRTSV